MPKAGSSRNSPIPSPSLSRGSPSQNELKVPLIRWDKNFAGRTTKLITWFKENEAAQLKLFSDSTQDAKDSNRRKEVSGRSRSYYYSEAAKAIFANDVDNDVRHCSQVRPDLFAQKIDRRIKELRKAYNAENKKLGQTGIGMTYAQLQSDSSKSNIIASIVESLPWWPDLHGFWRTNPGFNTSPATADPGQDFEGEALTLFRLGHPNSEASSPNDTGTDSSFVPSPNPNLNLGLFNFGSNACSSAHTSDGDLGLGPLFADSFPSPQTRNDLDQPIPGSSTTGPGEFTDELFSEFFNMDIDGDGTSESNMDPLAFPLPGSGSESRPCPRPTPLPTLNPSESLDPSSSLLRAGFHDQNMLFESVCSSPGPRHSELRPLPPPAAFLGRHVHSLRGIATWAPVPFSFRGGAPCILPPITGKVISLNSDDESDNPSSRYPSQHLSQPQPSPSPSQPHPSTSSYFSDTSLQPGPALTVSTPPTSVHDNMSSSAAGSSRRSAAKGKRPQAAAALAVSASERLVMQADTLISKGTGITESYRNERVQRHEAHYQNKEAERNHQQWLAQFNANHEKDMAELRLKQLEHELELEKLRTSKSGLSQ